MKNRIIVILLAVFVGIGLIPAGELLGISPHKAGAAASDVSNAGSVTVDEILNKAKENQSKLKLKTATGKDSWTLAVYMCGSDLERNDGAATRDMCEMLGSGIPDNLNLIVMTGGAGDKLWKPEGVVPTSGGYVKPEGTQIWQFADGKMNLLYKYDKYQDMSDKNVAGGFFKFAAQYAPADHMMVQFWDHGGGPVKGAEFSLMEDGSDNRYMPLNDIVSAVDAVKKVRTGQGHDLDIIGFDCCLMSSVEIAYALKDKADYMIGSEELEPTDGWDYYWLRIFKEIKGKSDKEQCEMIGKRAVDLFPADKVVDKQDTLTLGDLKYAEKLWKGRSDLFKQGTLALIDLSRIDNVMAALDDFGAALKKIYDNRKKKKSAFLKLSKAIKNVKYMSAGVYGQADIYDLANKLRKKNITKKLNNASDKLIAAVADGSKPKAQTIKHKEKDPDTGKTKVIKEKGGQVGAPGTTGAVIYRGVNYVLEGCGGMAVFCPANIEVESVYLDAVTGKNRTKEKYKGKYNNAYNGLAFSTGRAAAGYVAYVKAMAGLQDRTRDFGIHAGKIKAVNDERRSTVYMKTKKGAASKLVSVYAEVSLETLKHSYYLGNVAAKYNKKKKRYEVPDRHKWMSVGGVPVTYENHGFGDCVMPVVIELKGDKGRFAEGKYKVGDKVKQNDICYLSIDSGSISKGRVKLFKWTDPYMNQDHEMNSAEFKSIAAIHPLRQKQAWDYDKMIYKKGDFIVNKKIKMTIEGEASEGWDFREVYMEKVKMKRPSKSSGYLMIYNFKAYDMNTKAYASNSVYVLENNWKKLKLSPVKKQKFKGKAVKPKLRFSLAGYSGITLKNLREASPGVKIKVIYRKNKKPGKATVIVKGTDRGTKETLYKLKRTFRIVR